MLITRRSGFTGVTHTLDLDITAEQIARYEGGELLQRAFPSLTPGDREFIKTGVIREEWDAEFKGEES